MTEPRTLVVVFLRGGMDGLSAVAPYAEAAYHRARPTLRLAEPRSSSMAAGPLRLDDRFALHEDLAALRPLWDDQRLAIVHAIGSDDSTRSHFEAQDQMEHGASEAQPVAGGWAARWLRSAAEGGALSAIAFGTQLPESLRGAPSACSVESLDELAVGTKTGDAKGFAAALAALHPDGGPSATALVRKGARDALALLDRVEELRRDAKSAPVAAETDLGRALSQVARLVESDVGLRIATIDHGGFDTHFGQAVGLPGRLKELGEALAGFDRILGGRRDRVTTLCVTEFGRRLAENSSLGTDHGRGGVAFALGGGVRGGRVVCDWPGLAEDSLDDGLDLKVTTDYRDLLWETLAARFGATDVASVFPGHAPRPVGVMG
ncbi:MAG: DUF1501 domain-containing protein [Planctomycetes bacterium]|nr:DUF1501 domain-containing protein [Planctomycetota bacterium]